MNGEGFFDEGGVNPPAPLVNGSGVFVKGPVPHDVENNYGFSVGGPVWLPKLYNGRDKTFFYTSWDWYRVNAPASSNLTVPAQPMVGGELLGFCRDGVSSGVFNV